MSISDSKRAEISTIVREIKSGTAYFSGMGISINSSHEMNEAMEIIKRIERRMIENQQSGGSK